MDNHLEERFDAAMMDTYRRAKSEANYDASSFFRMLTKHRGLETARILLHAETVSDDYTALRERDRLDLTVEALIFDNREYHPFFTPEELATVRRRLEECKYPSAIDPIEPLIGAFASDIPNWTLEHDKYIGEAIYQSMREKNDNGS